MHREGGDRGGGVSELETLPGLNPMGVSLSGRMGSEGMGQNKHGMDEGHQHAGVAAGVMVHGAGDARGGYYHCMAGDCSFKTRKKHGMAQHSTKHNKKHGAGSSDASASSSSVPSSPASGSSKSGQSHGMSDYTRGDCGK